MEYFARHGRALNAELRGHGESDKPQQGYSVEGFADDLVWLCNQQQIANPVIVGQSMGGNMALEIAARYPDLPSGLVLLNSGVLFPASAGKVFAGYVEGLNRARTRGQTRKIVAATAVCRPTDAAPMSNRPFQRRHSTCWCPRLKVCFPGMCIARACAPRRATSRCSTSKRPIGSRTGSPCGTVSATGHGQGRRLRTFPVAGSAGADQPDDRPVYLALRAKSTGKLRRCRAVRRINRLIHPRWHHDTQRARHTGN